MESQVSKQIYDLSPRDLEQHPVWIFPMDESVEDEASVRPVNAGEIVPSGLQRIVRCRFSDSAGRPLIGYVYPGAGDDVEAARPVAWCGDLCITFWNGMIEPDAEDVQLVKDLGLQWPINFLTEIAGEASQSGVLRGLYYLAGDEVCCIDCA